MTTVTLTTAYSMFQIAKWYKHPLVWVKRLLGYGEPILVSNELYRVHRVTSETYMEIRPH